MKFAVVDIETTGPTNKITEVGVVHIDDGVITRKWSSLVNPREFLPNNIIWLTGITQDMVDGAPLFEDIAEELFSLTEDRIFVAHSVNFDYGIIKSHFSKLNMPFNRRRLCTVRLSRSIIPGKNSYSLGKLCANLGIGIEGRHRALGDAEATAVLFQLLLRNDKESFIDASLKRQHRESLFPPGFSRDQYEKLPVATGIYRFHDKDDKIIYVGKAVNLKKRIEGHFLEHGAEKSVFRNKIYKVTYELTGTELLAYLREACEIKAHFPEYNKAAKYATNSFGFVLYNSLEGKQMIGIAKKTRYLQLKGSFSSMLQARDYLKELVVTYELCPALCGLQKRHTCPNCETEETCFGSEEPEIYNQKVANAIQENWLLSKSYVCVLKGRHQDEIAYFLMDNGIYQGYGFVEANKVKTETLWFKDALIKQNHFSEIDRILRMSQSSKDIEDIILVQGLQKEERQVLQLF